MAAAGKVCTGFSLPYVALYSCTGGTIAYSEGRQLARGVDVSIEPDTSDDNKFHADNQAAETDAGSFTGGTLSLTVDGLFAEAESMIMGLPAADSSGWITYDDDQAVPYVGVGFIARYQSEGVVTFAPNIIVKASFNQIQSSHATSEDSVNYQTQALSAQILRADDAKHSWKKIPGTDFATEALALAALKTALNISD